VRTHALVPVVTASLFSLPLGAAAAGLDSAAVSGLGARNVGSAVMSGRISAVAARQEKDGKVTLFVGAASGGVWKSLDGGTTFKPVFDKQPVQSIGAIAMAMHPLPVPTSRILRVEEGTEEDTHSTSSSVSGRGMSTCSST